MSDIGKKLYELKLFDSLRVSYSSNDEESVMRVPGGWLHKIWQDSDSGTIAISTTFIPYSEEFKNG